MGWTVAQVMTRDVVFATLDTSFWECADLMRIHAVSALPVLNATQRVVGIVSESDLLAKEEARAPSADSNATLSRRRRRAVAARKAEDIMSSSPVTVNPSTTVAEAARLMHSRRVKRLPVVDEYGGLVGIVSRADLLKVFLRSDESIRREIMDHVLRRKLCIDPATLEVQVRKGLVRIRGQVETRSLARLIERGVAEVEGTIGVDSSLSFRLDDSGPDVEEPPRSLRRPAVKRTDRLT